MTISDEMIRHVAGEPLERQKRFATHRALYEGDMPEPLQGSTAALDNVLIPAMQTIIDKSVSFLFGGELLFDVREAYGEDAQLALERFWRGNKIPTRLIELGKHGATTGAFVLKFEPDADDARDGSHRIVVVDPSYLDVMWDPHDVSQVLLYRVEYPTVDYHDGALKPFVWRQDIEAVRSEPDVYGRRVILSWHITNYRAVAPVENGRRVGMQPTQQAARWEQVSDYPWPHAWSPIFAGQNLVSANAWWGYSDIECALQRLSTSTNRVASNLAKTIRHFAHPRTVVRGGKLASDLPIGAPIEFDADPSMVDVSNLEMQSDLSASLEFLRELRSEVYEAGRTPEIARGKVDNVGQLSGVAMRILYGPLLEKTGEKRRTYGDVLESLLRCILEYMGFAPLDEGDASVRIVWPDPLPVDEKVQAETAEIDQRLGASKRTTLERRGYDPDVEAENALEEGASDPGMRGMLDLIGAPETDAQPTEERRSVSATATDASVEQD